VTEIVSAKNGTPTICKDGNYLLSRYDPEKEIERALSGIRPGPAFVVFGSALGMIPHELARLGIPTERIFVIEPERMLLENSAPALYALGILCYGDVPIDKLTLWMESALAAGYRPEMLSLPAFERAYPGEYKLFEAGFRHSLTLAVENLKVEAYFSKVWFINYFRNLSSIVSHKNRYIPAGTCAGQTDAVPLVIAAGPSLNGRLDEILRYRDKYFIISVLSAARTMLSGGITPNLVVLSDAGPANILHFRGIPEHVPVFASVYANSALISAIPNPVIFYDLEAQMTTPSYRNNSPSVTIDAGLLALRLFKRKPIFCGFDLCYSERYGSHSGNNALSELRRKKSITRIQTFDTYTQSFRNRKDILIDDGKTTNRHLQLLHRLAGEMFAGCGYIEGGVRFSTLMPVSLESHGSTGTMCNTTDLYRAIPMEIQDKVRTILTGLIKELNEGSSGLKGTVFIREKLAGVDSGAVSGYYIHKCEQILRSLPGGNYA
jgi:hypothetical protein